MRTALVRVFVLLAAGTVALAFFFQLVYRPWQRHWGATEQEIGRAMPGDEIISTPEFNATRAVTVHGRPEEIWPWLVQLGYGRAGFYSYDRLDNDGIPSADEILPEFQTLEVGDEVPLSKTAAATVVELEPNRSLVLMVGRDPDRPPAFTWVWGLYPVDSERTRLVSRLRWRVESSSALLFLDAFEIWMMRKCLLGIKRRVETANSG